MLSEELGPFLLLLQAPRVLPVLGQRLTLLAEAAAPSFFSAPGIGTGPSFTWVSAAIWKSQLWVVNSQREGLFPSWASVGGSEAAPILGFLHHPAALKPGILLHLLLGYSLPGNPRVTNYASGNVHGNRPFSARAQSVFKRLVESQELLAASLYFETGWPPAGCESKMKGCEINPLVRESEPLPEAAQHQRSSF